MQLYGLSLVTMELAAAAPCTRQASVTPIDLDYRIRRELPNAWSSLRLHIFFLQGSAVSTCFPFLVLSKLTNLHTLQPVCVIYSIRSCINTRKHVKK